MGQLLSELDDELALLAGAIDPLERVVYGRTGTDAALPEAAGIGR